jgi:copper transport protein
MPPGRVESAESAGAAVTATAGAYSVAVDLDPARAGTNDVVVTVTTADGEPFDAVDARVALSLPDRALFPFTVTLTKTAPGVFEGSAELTLPGTWTAEVTVTTTDVDSEVAEVTIPVT